MTRERKELIQEFEKWFATNPNPSITAAQCANIAEDYAKSKIKKLAVVKSVCCDKCGKELKPVYICTDCLEVEMVKKQTGR